MSLYIFAHFLFRFFFLLRFRSSLHILYISPLLDMYSVICLFIILTGYFAENKFSFLNFNEFQFINFLLWIMLLCHLVLFAQTQNLKIFSCFLLNVLQLYTTFKALIHPVNFLIKCKVQIKVLLLIFPVRIPSLQRYWLKRLSLFLALLLHLHQKSVGHVCIPLSLSSMLSHWLRGLSLHQLHTVLIGQMYVCRVDHFIHLFF